MMPDYTRTATNRGTACFGVPAYQRRDRRLDDV
jgi:hypothetical protein